MHVVTILNTCMVKPSFWMMSLPSLVQGAGDWICVWERHQNTFIVVHNNAMVSFLAQRPRGSLDNLIALFELLMWPHEVEPQLLFWSIGRVKLCILASSVNVTV